MASVSNIAEFLREVGQFEGSTVGDDGLWAKEVIGICTDKDAGEGDLAWVSARYAKTEPERMETFRGSLLICPTSVRFPGSSTYVALPCINPKLAFIRVINKFFSELSLPNPWPRLGQDPVALDAIIHQDVVLSSGVVIGSGVVIQAGVTIGPNTAIANAIIKRNVHIGANCSIGSPGFGFERDENGKYWRFPHIGKVIIEEDVEIGCNTCIDRGSVGETIIEAGAKIDNLVHIAHNVIVGVNSLVIANSMIGGSVRIGRGAWIAPSVSVMNQLSIGESATLGMGAVVIKSVDDSAVVVGNPAKPMERKIKS
ncbi:MAG: UDP-3-O-(3-hydroxymyristoyl)glucosamine N-acyltransferase [Blastocatellia bacterium]